MARNTGATGAAAPERDSSARWYSSPLDIKGSLLTPSEGWVTVALLFAMNLVAIVTVMQSEWVSPMPRLWLVALLATFLSLGAMKYSGPLLLQFFAHVLVLGIGFGVALAETANALSGNAGEKFDEMFLRLDAWVSAVSAQGISSDRLPFVFILVALTWLIMYLSTLFTFKLRWTWLAVIPPALGLMTNQTYVPSSEYVLPIFFFLLFAILFMGRTHFLHRTRAWKTESLEQRTGRYAFAANALLLTAIVFVVAWAAPTKKIVLDPIKATYHSARAPWVDLEDDFERMFAGIPSRKGGPLHSFGVALPLRGSVGLSSAEVLTVTTDFPAYWRAQVYDFYQGRGWIANRAQRTEMNAGQVPVAPEGEGYRKREVVAQQFRLETESDLVFTGGEPVDINIDAKAEVSVPRVFDISLGADPQPGKLPPDLFAAATRIVNTRGSLNEIKAMLPPGTVLLDDRRDSITVTRDNPVLPDVLSVRSEKRLKAGQPYEVLSSVSIATLRDLQRDNSSYPAWIMDAYLQLPPEMPPRVRDLALRITEGARTPHDKAVAVEGFLRQFEETYSIQPPPLNVDAVDYFLFTGRAGYSDYFASAMAVLLRAADVPTRLASGYATGVFDPETSSFSVKQSHAHSWPEVYFPNYGWIPFEPLPSLESIPRGPLEQPGLSAPAGPEGSLEELFEEDLFPEEEFLSDLLGPDDEPLGGEVFRNIAKTTGLIVGGLVAFLLAVGLVMTAAWQVNFIGLPYGPGIYSRMTKLGALAWRGPDRMETPTEYASKVSSALELRPGQAGTVARGFMKSRYSGRPLSDADQAEVQRAWTGLRTALLRRLIRRLNLTELFRRGG